MTDLMRTVALGVLLFYSPAPRWIVWTYCVCIGVDVLLSLLAVGFEKWKG